MFTGKRKREDENEDVISTMLGKRKREDENANVISTMLGKRKREDENKDIISTMAEEVIENMLPYLDNLNKRRFSQTSTWIRKVVLRFGKVKFYLTKDASILFYNDLENIRSRMAGRYLFVKFEKRADVVDLSCFENVQEVELIKCHNVTNVSPLRNCKYVYLDNCREVRDVRSLGNVKKLQISQNYDNNPSKGIVGFSSLGNVQDLELWQCINLSNEDLLHFVNIPKLRLRYCQNITSVNCLANNKSLELCSCFEISDVRSLSRVVLLKIVGCFRITDVSCLVHNESLEFVRCMGITDVSSLARVPLLIIEGWYGITNVSSLSSVPMLKIKGCRGITTWGSLTSPYDEDETAIYKYGVLQSDN